MSKRKKILLAILMFLATVLVVIMAVVPRLLNMDRYRSQVEALLEKRLGRRTTIGHLALTVFPRLSTRVDGFALKNPASFPQGDFITDRLEATREALNEYQERPVLCLEHSIPQQCRCQVSRFLVSRFLGRSVARLSRRQGR